MLQKLVYSAKPKAQGYKARKEGCAWVRGPRRET